MMVDSSLTSYVAFDGENLALQEWPLPSGLALRGAVLLVHGLGEHAGRYDPLAQWFCERGFAVRGYDQYGHGQSSGTRGGLPNDTKLLDDLSDLVEHTRSHIPPGKPLLLLGHSLGGLVAARWVAEGRLPVDGLILSSPALDAGFSPLQRLLLAVLPRLAPNLRVGNGLDPRYLSHDTQVVQAYREDPQVHDRISARLARFIAESGPRVLAQAPVWKVPTLLLFAGDDHLVNPRGSRAFAAAAPACVRSHEFPTLYHEIFNEAAPMAQSVYAALRAWLDTQT